MSIDKNITLYAQWSRTPTTYEYVDLGLPSGLKWATCNVGASKPEEYGDYFAWGEVKPKEYYDWNTYKWCNGNSNTLTKYCLNSDYGIADNKTILDPEDDAATVNWGSNWRMPTKEEQDELCEHCTWKWIYSIGGYEVIGPNGNSIFLPIAGYRFEESLVQAGMIGLYLSSSLASYSADAYYIGFEVSGVNRYPNSRFWGYTIRPVYE